MLSSKAKPAASDPSHRYSSDEINKSAHASHLCRYQPGEEDSAPGQGKGVRPFGRVTASVLNLEMHTSWHFPHAPMMLSTNACLYGRPASMFANNPDATWTCRACATHEDPGSCQSSAEPTTVSSQPGFLASLWMRSAVVVVSQLPL